MVPSPALGLPLPDPARNRQAVLQARELTFSQLCGRIPKRSPDSRLEYSYGVGYGTLRGIYVLDPPRALG